MTHSIPQKLEFKNAPKNLQWYWYIPAALIIFFFAFLYRYSFFSLEITNDPGLWATVCQDKLLSHSPKEFYIDYWDHKPPLMYYSLLAFSTVLDSIKTAIHAYDFFFLFASSYLVFLFYRLYNVPFFIGILGSFLFICFNTIDSMAAATPGFAERPATFFEVLSIYFMALRDRCSIVLKPNLSVFVILSSLSCVAAVLFKQSSLFVLLMSLLYLCVSSLRKHAFGDLSSYLFGLLVGLFLFLLYVVFQGRFNPLLIYDILYQIISYNIYYVATPGTARSFSDYLYVVKELSIGVISIVVIITMYIFRRLSRFDRIMIYSSLHFLSSIMFLLFIGAQRMTLHYLIPLSFGLSVSCVVAITSQYTSCVSGIKRRIHHMLFLFLFAASLFYVFDSYRKAQQLKISPFAAEHLAAEDYIKGKYSVEGKYVFFDNAVMNLRTKTLLVTRYFIPYPVFYVDHPRRALYEAAFFEDLRNRPPLMVVLRGDRTAYYLPSQSSKFFNWLNDNYVLLEIIPGKTNYAIWYKKECAISTYKDVQGFS